MPTVMEKSGGLLLLAAFLWLPMPAASVPLEAPDRHQLRSWHDQLALLPPAERARLERARQDVSALTPEQQQALRERFGQLDGLHRDGWRLGPTVGKYWPGLQPLLGLVTEPERQPLRQWLWSLTEDDLVRLVRLSERTPPQARGDVRRQLLEVPPSQRQRWLREKVGG